MHTGFLLSAALAALAQAPEARPAPGQAGPAAPSASLPAASLPAAPAEDVRYHTLDEVAERVRTWIGSAAPDRVLVEKVDLPSTSTGLPVPALAFGAPGAIPLAERPTVLLLGGLDGVSLS